MTVTLPSASTERISPRFDDSVIERELRMSPPIVTATPNAWSLLRALKRRWFLAAILGLIGASSAAAAAWFTVSSTATGARAMLRLDPEQQSIVFKLNETQSTLSSFRATQIALMKSRLVLNAALRQPKVADCSLIRAQNDPLSWLERELVMSSPGSPEILVVAMNGTKSEEIKIIVEAVVNAYLTEIVNKFQTTRRTRLDHLKEIQTRYEETLRRKRKLLRDLVEDVGSQDKETLALKQRLAQEQLATTQRELLQVRSDIRRLEIEVRQKPDPNGVEISDAAIETILSRDPVLLQYREAKSVLEQQLETTRLRAVKGDKEPAVQRIRRDLATIDKSIANRTSEIRPMMEKQLREETVSRMSASLNESQQKLRGLAELEQTLAREVKRLSEEGRVLNKGSLDIETYKSEIAQAESIAHKVADEVEKLSVELQAPPRVSLLEEATIMNGDGEAKRFRTAGLAGFGTLGLICLAIAGWEFRARRVDNVEQVVQGLGLRLVGTVPAAPPRPLMWLPGFNRRSELTWERLVAESINTARTLVMHVARTEGWKVVLITSAGPGEAKTSVATQLAASLARAGRKTLLIDGDLRNPSVAEFLELPPASGLCEVLRGELSWQDAVQVTPADGLWLLQAGQSCPTAFRALSREELGRLFAQLRAEFDFIIVDSSPVLPVADTLLLSAHVDAAILSVLRQVSQLPQVHAAGTKLAMLQVRLLGAIVCGTNESVASGSYQYVGRPGE